MAAFATKIPSEPLGWRVCTVEDDRRVDIEHPQVSIFKNEADLIDRVYRDIDEIDKPRIFVPGSSLRKIHDACVSKMPQTDRIIGYFETEDDIKYYKQNSAEHISWKVQYCLTRNLRRVLNGEEIRSILYQDGPIDRSALNDVVGKMQQRLMEKEKAAQSAPVNISTGPIIDERCRHCEQLVATRNSCQFCSTATPLGSSPQNDCPINHSIAANYVQYPRGDPDTS